jgi:hypothetical protein
MLTAANILHLPYTSDLTEGGIAYALRSLPNLFEYAGSKPYDRIRRMVAGVAVELAFRRYLSQQNIPFDIKAPMPFTEPDKYNVTLGGRRCDIKSFLISQRDQILQMRSQPSVMLNAPALVPSDHQSINDYSDHDLYLFAFLSGLIAASQTDLKKVVETDQPHYLIHVLPDEWRKPLRWRPLVPLTLKSESDSEMQVEVNGQDEARGFLTRVVNLPAQKRIILHDRFYSVTALHVKNIPEARLGIHSPSHKEAHVIAPLDWGNIWVYGMDIYLAGFISRAEFRQRAKLVAQNSTVFQYTHTKTKNMAVPVAELKSMQELFTRVREWAG